MGKTKIEWADKVWNPVTGCTKVSAGCKNCYAERMAKRLAGRCGYPAENPFAVTLHPDKLDEPMRWRKPSRIFVCSMGDLFHEDVPFGFVMRALYRMAQTPHHTYLILTKRPERMKAFFMQWGDLSGEDFAPKLVRGPAETRKAHPSGRGQLFADMLEFMGTPPQGCAYPTFDWAAGMIGWTNTFRNIYLGVSVEDQMTADERIPLLLQTLAAKRLVSYEPAIGSADFTPYLRIAWQCSFCSRYYPDPLKEVCPDCGKRGGWTGSHIFNPPGGQRGSGLDWVIMGGESGPGARPLHPDWARSVRDQCKAAGVPFWFKQRGEWGITTPPPPEKQHPNYKGLFVCPDATSRMFNNPCPEAVWMEPVGKARAGCLLDGKEYKEIPD